MSRFLPFTPEDLVWSGEAQRILASTDTGYKSYNTHYAGKGRAFLPTSTNLWTDPQGRYADGTTSCPSSSANTTVTANTAVPAAVPRYPEITTCLMMVNDGTAENIDGVNIAVSASTSYFAQLFIYAPTLGGNLTVYAENGHEFTVAALTSANTGWVQYSAPCDTVGGETTLYLRFAFAGGTASTVYVTGMQVGASTMDYRPYFDGTFSNCSWSGTAHKSSSAQTVSAIRYTLTAGDYNTGTFACKTTPVYSAATVITRPMFYIRNAADNNYTCYGVLTSGALWQLNCRGSGNLASSSGAVTFNAYTEHCYVGRWAQGGSGTIDVNYDGTNTTQTANTETLASGTYLAIGMSASSIGGNKFFNCILSKQRKTDAWTTAIQANSGAAYDDPQRLWYEFMTVGDILFPLMKDSVGYQKVG